MADLRLYMEKIAGESPSTAGFTRMGGGKSHRIYYIGDDGQRDGSGNPVHDEIESASEVYDAVIDLMGETKLHSDGFRLNRKLPKADPFWQWLFVDEIANITGLGRMTQVVSTPGQQLEAPAIDYVAFYPGMRFDVNFTPRPYALIQDGQIATGTVNWANQRGVETTTTYAEEWLRYTDQESIPGGEYITAQSGQFLIDVAAGVAPNNIPATGGQLRMFVASEGIKITWYEVPYSYVDSGDYLTPSYLMQGLGCVNQYDWRKYGKGQLMLESIGVQRYTPTIPQVQIWDGNRAVFTNNKLCNITFIMKYTDRGIGKDINGNDATPTVPAAYPATAGPIQTVQTGWNLVPYAHMMSWFYAKTRILGYSEANNRPIFPSFPFQLLFTNPGIEE